MPPELAIAQFVAYVSLTIAGLTVAIVSLRFSYRQNFGWDPLLLITSHGLRSYMVHGYAATLSMEFWNRRKYPLVLRVVTVNFSVLDLEEPGPHKVGDEPTWTMNAARKCMYYRREEALEPNGHKKLLVEAPFKKRSLDDLVDEMTITATYYDPRQNKSLEIKKKFTYRLK